MAKLTKETIEHTLTNRPILASADNLKGVFELFGFRLKEFKKRVPPMAIQQDQFIFEVHYRRTYIIKAHITQDSHMVTFSNEWIKFEDKSSGVSMPVRTVTELILAVMNLFMHKLNINYQGPTYSEESEYTFEEMSELLEFAQSKLVSRLG